MSTLSGQDHYSLERDQWTEVPLAVRSIEQPSAALVSGGAIISVGSSGDLHFVDLETLEAERVFQNDLSSPIRWAPDVLARVGETESIAVSRTGDTSYRVRLGQANAPSN